MYMTPLDNMASKNCSKSHIEEIYSFYSMHHIKIYIFSYSKLYCSDTGHYKSITFESGEV